MINQPENRDVKLESATNRMNGIARAYGSKIIAKVLAAIEANEGQPTDQLKVACKAAMREETNALGRQLVVSVPQSYRHAIVFTGRDEISEQPPSSFNPDSQWLEYRLAREKR